MRQKFPQFKLGQAEDEHIVNNWKVVSIGQKYWMGQLKTVAGNIYTVLLAYPNYYPGGEIRAYIVLPHISHGNHRYGDGHLCLYSNDHGGKGQGAGPGMTAVSYVAWVSARQLPLPKFEARICQNQLKTNDFPPGASPPPKSK